MSTRAIAAATVSSASGHSGSVLGPLTRPSVFGAPLATPSLTSSASSSAAGGFFRDHGPVSEGLVFSLVGFGAAAALIGATTLLRAWRARRG